MQILETDDEGEYKKRKFPALFLKNSHLFFISEGGRENVGRKSFPFFFGKTLWGV
jgi:hypothetical protein